MHACWEVGTSGDLGEEARGPGQGLSQQPKHICLGAPSEQAALGGLGTVSEGRPASARPGVLGGGCPGRGPMCVGQGLDSVSGEHPFMRNLHIRWHFPTTFYFRLGAGPQKVSAHSRWRPRHAPQPTHVTEPLACAVGVRRSRGLRIPQVNFQGLPGEATPDALLCSCPPRALACPSPRPLHRPLPPAIVPRSTQP